MQQQFFSPSRIVRKPAGGQEEEARGLALRGKAKLLWEKVGEEGMNQRQPLER